MSVILEEDYKGFKLTYESGEFRAENNNRRFTYNNSDFKELKKMVDAWIKDEEEKDLKAIESKKKEAELEVLKNNFSKMKLGVDANEFKEFIRAIKEINSRAEFRGTDNEQVGASWECRNCIVLDDEEYNKKRNI